MLSIFVRNMDFMLFDVFSIFLLSLYATCISVGLYWILRRVLKSFCKAENLPGPGKYSPSAYYVILDSNTSPSSPPLKGQIFNPTLPLPLGDLSCNLKNSYLEKPSGPGETTEPLLDQHPNGPLSCSPYQEGSSSPVHHHLESIFRFDLGAYGPPPPCRSDPVKPSSSESVPCNQTVHNEWYENGFPGPAPASSNRLPVHLGEWSEHGYGAGICSLDGYYGWPHESGKDARADDILHRLRLQQALLHHSQESSLRLNPLKDAPPGSSNPADHSLESNLALNPLKDAPVDNLQRQKVEQQLKLMKEQLQRQKLKGYYGWPHESGKDARADDHRQDSILTLNPLKDAPPGSSKPADHSLQSNLASDPLKDAPADNLHRQKLELLRIRA